MPTGLPTGLSTGRRASTSLTRGEILALIQDCDASLESTPHCLRTRAVRGHACMKAKFWERAIADFTLILNARPDDVRARFSRGMALFKSACIDNAHADFSRVLEVNPHHVMARYARAGCYNTEGHFYHAIEEYTLALQHDEMENDTMLSRHNGELSRGLFREEGGSATIQRLREDKPLQTHQRTIDAAVASSLPTRSAHFDPVRASAAVLSPLPPLADTSVQTARATKKPRKVVQVLLNLSDGTPVPASLGHVSAVAPSVQSVADVKVPGPPPPPPLPVAMASLSASDGGEAAASRAATVQVPRRQVRRVTIAL